MAVWLGAACLAAACTARPGGPPGPVLTNGIMVYGDGAPSTIACDARPVQLNGNHSDIRVTGGCRYVRITGEHNDISVEAAPGGTIEITGAHNDVTWTQVRPGPLPVLEDRGASNSFHAGGSG